MVDIIPSVFNRIDFWAMLLPGYVAVILGMILFFPSFLFNFNQVNTTNTIAKGQVNTTNSGTQGISFDIFSVVVFIVAGPAIGFTLSQAVIFFSFLLFFHNKYQFLLAYSHLRAVCKEGTRFELDAIDARGYFNSSTGVALSIIGVVLILQDQFHIEDYIKPLLSSEQFIARTFIGGLIIFVAGTLLVSAWLEFKEVRNPLVCRLLKENKVEEHPPDCEKYNQKNEVRKQFGALKYGSK